MELKFKQCPADLFGAEPKEKFDEFYLKFIADDLADAQANLDNLPEKDRRGLTLDTYRHFGCGYLPNWILTKSRAEFLCGLYAKDELSKEPKTLPPPSERIIIPTSERQFGAMATQSARSKMDKKYWKQRAGKMDGELFNAAAALNADLIVVVEGEIDAMSIWQCSGGQIAAVAILGCSNWKKTLLPRIAEFKGKKLLLLLDADAEGKKAAKKFLDELLQRGCLAVNRTLYDAMPNADQKEFGNRPKEVDANSILKHYGDAYLCGLLKRIITDAEPEFEQRQKEIDAQNLFMQEQAKLPDATIEDSQSEPSKHGINLIEYGYHDATSADKDEIKQILKDYVHARDLTHDDWLNVGRIMHDNGFSVDDFKQWSNDGDSRYDAKRCEIDWNSFRDAQDVKKPVTVATLIYLAKQRGYKPKSARAILPGVAQVFAGNTALMKRLDEWQEQNGKINPATLGKLKNALDALDALTPESITAADVYNNTHNAALVLCYGFGETHDKFIATIKAGKKIANERIKDSKTGLTKELSADERNALNALITVDIDNLRRHIEKEFNALSKAHKDFIKAENARIAKEKREKAREIRAIEITNAEERLKQLKKMEPSKKRDAEIIAVVNELCDWKHDKFGNPVKVDTTQNNLDLILGNDPALDGLFGFDEFADNHVFLKPAPWKKKAQKGDEWTDDDDARAQTYIRRHYKEFAAENLFQKTFVDFSHARSFHEVKEYFQTLPKWDGQTRAETLFIDWLKVEDTPFTREVTMKILLAAVARIFCPGCPFQNSVIIHGNQKIGKGYILERLGGKWYKAITDRVDDPHAVDAARICWIGEFKEMAGMRKADADAIKEFIELSADTRRFSYDKRAKTVPRHCVFFITVNDEQFLIDMTGNRRFWILHSPLPKFGYVKEVRGESLKDDNVIAQIWAEVYLKYQELFPHGVNEKNASLLELSPELEFKGEEIAEQYLRDDGMTGEIKSFLDTKTPPPVVWDLLTKDERRKYYVEGQLTIDIAILNFRRRARGGRSVEHDINEIYKICHSKDKGVREVFAIEGGTPRYQFFGTEYRQRICAAEIFTECFGNDRRKSMLRIHEILARLDGWSLGKRIQKDPAYGDQKKVYYRNADNVPADDDEPPAVQSTDATTEATHQSGAVEEEMDLSQSDD